MNFSVTTQNLELQRNFFSTFENDKKSSIFLPQRLFVSCLSLSKLKNISFLMVRLFLCRHTQENCKEPQCRLICPAQAWFTLCLVLTPMLFQKPMSQKDIQAPGQTETGQARVHISQLVWNSSSLLLLSQRPLSVFSLLLVVCHILW